MTVENNAHEQADKSRKNAAELQLLETGLAFGESPRWHEGRLWFSNWDAQEIIAVDPQGASEVVVRVPFPSFPFSIDWLPDGRLIIVSTSDQPLLRREQEGTLVPHADLNGLAKVWNEIVVDGRGNIYVNGGDVDLSAPGIIALIKPDGSTRLVADGIAFPNGMVVTPDNSTLIISESFGQKLTAFDIADDGTLLNRRVWADLGDGYPDGICLDTEGAIWYSDVPNKRCVRVREGGEIVQRVELDQGCFACMLGGADRTTLFLLTAEWRGFDKMAGSRTGQLLSIQVSVPGAEYKRDRLN
ncbi:SMP-30/gluconolactonase/LRE family protein [Paenibacillus sp. GP183]|uniref:SMP-30/gluconolactonase/LRE family protein n=1 Tax=Paenibacillus sp. GP183 TaxID=1882751 RepID=UPI000897E31E|nr:SMP-30/gluconolactonase/LRE family protein [Paenibacillus sp. GP183]SEC49815.1 Sugar lactone lactonase YvrE [Paenibacillus sp. GP183]